MQTDVDTIIAHTKLGPVSKQKNDLSPELNMIRGKKLQDSINQARISKDNDQFSKLVVANLNVVNEMTLQEANNLKKLLKETETKNK